MSGRRRDVTALADLGTCAPGARVFRLGWLASTASRSEPAASWPGRIWSSNTATRKAISTGFLRLRMNSRICQGSRTSIRGQTMRLEAQPCRSRTASHACAPGLTRGLRPLAGMVALAARSAITAGSRVAVSMCPRWMRCAYACASSPSLRHLSAWQSIGKSLGMAHAL